CTLEYGRRSGWHEANHESEIVVNTLSQTLLEDDCQRVGYLIRSDRGGSRRVVDLVFFFQAEDGIRDLTVTGVQTCALPICPAWSWIAPEGWRCAAAVPRRRLGSWPGTGPRPRGPGLAEAGFPTRRPVGPIPARRPGPGRTPR